jgi:hypothetical protein
MNVLIGEDMSSWENIWKIRKISFSLYIIIHSTKKCHHHRMQISSPCWIMFPLNSILILQFLSFSSALWAILLILLFSCNDLSVQILVHGFFSFHRLPISLAFLLVSFLDFYPLAMLMTNTNQALCKFRIFIFFDSSPIASWLITLATADRWISSSTDVNRWQRSTLKNAQRGMLLIAVLSTIIERQQIFCYEANLINTPLKCYS